MIGEFSKFNGGLNQVADPRDRDAFALNQAQVMVNCDITKGPLRPSLRPSLVGMLSTATHNFAHLSSGGDDGWVEGGEDVSFLPWQSGYTRFTPDYSSFHNEGASTPLGMPPPSEDKYAQLTGDKKRFYKLSIKMSLQDQLPYVGTIPEEYSTIKHRTQRLTLRGEEGEAPPEDLLGAYLYLDWSVTAAVVTRIHSVEVEEVTNVYTLDVTLSIHPDRDPFENGGTLGFSVDDVVPEFTIEKAATEVVEFEGTILEYESDDQYPEGSISPLESVTILTLDISEFNSIVGASERVWVSARPRTGVSHSWLSRVVHKSQAANNTFMDSGTYRYLITNVSSDGVESPPFIPTTDPDVNEAVGLSLPLSANIEGQYILTRKWDKKAFAREYARLRSLVITRPEGGHFDRYNDTIRELADDLRKAFTEEQELLPQSEIMGNDLSGDPFWPVVQVPSALYGGVDRKVRLYRTTSAGGALFLAKEFTTDDFNGATTVEYVDWVTDWVLIGNPLLETEDLLPPIYKYTGGLHPTRVYPHIVESHLGRVWAAVDDRVYFSEAGVAGQWGTGNWFQLNGQVTALVSLVDKLLVFTRTSLSIIAGQGASSFTKVELAGLYGAISHKTIARVAGRVVWVSDQGIFAYSADSLTNHTEHLLVDFVFSEVTCATVDGSEYVAFYGNKALRLDFARGAILKQEELLSDIVVRDAHTKRSDGQACVLALDSVNSVVGAFALSGGGPNPFTYRTGIAEDKLAGVTKTYSKVFAHIIGNADVDVYIDERLVYTWEIQDGTGPLSVYLPTSQDLRGEGISFEITGTGTLHYVRYEYAPLQVD